MGAHYFFSPPQRQLSNGNVMTHYVHVPLRLSDQMLRIDINELPPCEQLIQILENEEAPLDVWLQAASGYYNTDRESDFLRVLQAALETTSSADRECIKIHNAIAAYYSHKAYLATDPEERKYFSEKANDALSQSDYLDNYNQKTWLCKGLFYLYSSNDLDRASEQFRFIFDDNPNLSDVPIELTPALIGRAVILYHQRRFSDALDSFRAAIKTNPMCANEVRIGLGLCYYELGRERLARGWFQRALDVDPEDVNALLGMAVIEFNKPELRTRKEKGYEYIVRAFKVNPKHPRVLNYLARYCFHRHDHELALKLAEAASNLARSSMVKAESQYIIARTHQACRRFDQAMERFEDVLRLCPDHALGRHGLAQMNMYLGEQEAAIENLNEILKTNADSAEVSKFLGILESRAGHKAKAIPYLERAVLQISEDWECWIELAQIKEEININESLRAYESAVLALQNELGRTKKVSPDEASKLVPNELWNNVGALRHRAAQYETAEIAYLNSIASTGSQLQDFNIDNITCTYNLARLYEDTHRTSDATVLYSSILKEHPNLIECYLRLASIASGQRQIDEANNWIRCAFEIDLNSLDAWTHLGNIYFQERSWQKSQEKFEHILKKIDKNDNYALLALANIFFYAKSDSQVAPDRVAKYIKNAKDYYTAALKNQPNNLSGIGGMGCVLAFYGHLDAAQQCFIQVRENSVHRSLTCQSSINLAHVTVEQGRYSTALKMYSKCLERYFNNNDKELLLYVANCYFHMNELLNCKKALLRAAHINPTDSTIWYNLAITQSKYAALVSKKKKRATAAEARAALTEVDQSRAIFEKLIAKAQNPNFRRKYSSTLCGVEKKYCESLVKSLQRLLEDLIVKEDRENQESARRRQKAEEVRRALRAQEEEELRRASERKEKIAQEAARNREMQLEMEKKWAAEKRQRSEIDDDDAPSSSRKKRKKNDLDIVADDDEGYDSAPVDVPDESIEEMKSRRGGAQMAQLLQEKRAEESRRKQREIDELEAIRAENKHAEERNQQDDESPEAVIRTKLNQLLGDCTPEERKEYASWHKIGRSLMTVGLSKRFIKDHKDIILSEAKTLLKAKQ